MKWGKKQKQFRRGMGNEATLQLGLLQLHTHPKNIKLVESAIKPCPSASSFVWARVCRRPPARPWPPAASGR